MNDNHGDGGDPLAEAVQWHAKLQARPLPAKTVEDFYAWRREPAHRAAFEEVRSVHERTAAFEGSPAMQEAIQAALRREPRAPVAQPKRRWAMAGAAIVVLAAGWSALRWHEAPTRFATRVGERREITLDDGSKVMLATDTHLSVRYGATAREVSLASGEAFFTVAHNPARPFVVSAGRMRVTATGTQFDVRRIRSIDSVTLVRGGVTVGWPSATPTQLVAGQSFTASADTSPKVTTANPGAVTAWMQDRIVLDDATLAEAVAEENRYLDKPIHLDAPHFAASRLGGSFKPGDAKAFVAAVTATFPLEVVDDKDGSLRIDER